MHLGVQYVKNVLTIAYNQVSNIDLNGVVSEVSSDNGCTVQNI